VGTCASLALAAEPPNVYRQEVVNLLRPSQERNVFGDFVLVKGSRVERKVIEK